MVMQREPTVPIPLPVRLHLGRAAVQVIARQAGADLLHIKGDAVDRSLRLQPSAGSDNDVLVRPSHVADFDAALLRRGWTVYSTYANGSPFGHAQTYLHDTWGYLDVHRLFPGIGRDASEAFTALWADRVYIDFARVACAVPPVDAQAAILMLNAARSPATARRDIKVVWRSASAETQERVEAWIDVLDARVAFAASLGLLDQYRDDRSYLLWKAVSEGGTRIQEWRGRIRAAPTWRERLHVVIRAPRVNTDRLARTLGRSPKRADIVKEFFARARRGLRETLAAVRGARR
jgi:hypothetical protein